MYTVFDMEGDGEYDNPETGLTLQQAADRKLVRNGYSYEFRRVAGVMALFMEKHDLLVLTGSTPLGPTGMTSMAVDDDTAREDIMRQVIANDAPIGGSHTVSPDAEYAAVAAKIAGHEFVGNVGRCPQDENLR